MGPYSGLSADDIAKIESHYGVPAEAPAAPQNTEPFGPPLPPPVVPDAFQAKLDATLGPAPAPKATPAVWDPAATPLRPGEFTLYDPGKPPPQTVGPTAADDAEFAHASAQIMAPPAAPKPVARPAMGGASGAHSNPDPYGIRGAQKGVIDSYAAREEAMRRGASQQMDKAAVLGDATGELARRREEDASIQYGEQQAADADFDGRMTKLQRHMDDVRSQRVDPTRATKDIGFLAVIGGLVGGIYQGLIKSDVNPFIRDLDRMIDRDIAAQERNIDNSRQGVADEMNVLQQNRAQFKDSQAAKMATRISYYEAAQAKIEADAKRFDSAINKEAAEEGIQALEAEKQKQILAFAERNKALSAQGAASMYARDKEVREAYRHTYDQVLQHTGNPALAEQEANRQVGRMYSPGSVGDRQAVQSSDPVSMVPKDQRTEAVKELQAHANKDKVVGSVGQSFQAWRATGTTSPRQLSSTRSAIAGTIMANVPGIRSDVDFKEIVEPNLPAVGDSEETLRLKEATIRNFVDSKTTTPILDAHAPGWRQPSKDEVKQSLGMKGVR